MRLPTILAAMLIATPALAQTAPQIPEMVLMPRWLADNAANQIHHPDPRTNIDTLVLIQACEADNPQDGKITRMGEDQCPWVTNALAARDKALSDAQATIAARDKTIADLNAPKADEPAKQQPTAKP